MLDIETGNQGVRGLTSVIGNMNYLVFSRRVNYRFCMKVMDICILYMILYIYSLVVSGIAILPQAGTIPQGLDRGE